MSSPSTLIAHPHAVPLGWQAASGISRGLRNRRARQALLASTDEAEFRGLPADVLPS